MTQINTRGEGGGSKMVRKFNTYFLNGLLGKNLKSIYLFQLLIVFSCFCISDFLTIDLGRLNYCLTVSWAVNCRLIN